MSVSELFIRRPAATTLITIGVALIGMVAYFQLPVAPMPQVDFPTISVTANMPGANPETMATSVATPLERRLGQIADVSEMTSSSTMGQTNISVQFGLSRSLDGAARDVQAAINAARSDLPAALKTNPTYRKVNPTELPLLVLSATSATLSQGQLYDVATTVLQQKLSQVHGVGDVTISGSSLPAVRVELNPSSLYKYGVGSEDVRAALGAANANSPKGAIESDRLHWQIAGNDQGLSAKDFVSLVVAYRNGAAVRLSDVAEVTDGVEDIRNLGMAYGKEAVMIQITRQPGANIIATADRVSAMLPFLRASIPPSVTLTRTVDRTLPIRASLRDVEITLVLSVILVILVVFIFLRDWRATLIPAVAVPVSLIGTFAVMYLLDYTVDNLSLMALTISTGFVVDDAFVVMENIVRHIEAGEDRFRAALIGAKQVGSTVCSMTLSLVAVFIPILMMGGIVGRLFREFAITLSIAIAISMVVSLTTTPMMCAYLLRRIEPEERNRMSAAMERGFQKLLQFYQRTLAWALEHGTVMLGVLAVTIVLNLVLFNKIPKGFFPEQDTGRLSATVQADQSISFQRLAQKLSQMMRIIETDPDVESAVGSTGGSNGVNGAKAYIGLNPLGKRKLSVTAIMARFRKKFAVISGASVFLSAGQDIRVGGRSSAALYQYTLQADNYHDLQLWMPRLLNALKTEPKLADVNTDQQDNGLDLGVAVDRDMASRYGLTSTQIDNALYDAFGQRQVSTIYKQLNQYHVVMVVAPRFWEEPSTLDHLYVSTSGGAANGTATTNAPAGSVTALGGAVAAKKAAANSANDSAANARLNAIAATGKSSSSAGQAVSTVQEKMIPLSTFAHLETGAAPLVVNHQGQFAAATVSFNLVSGASLGDAVEAVHRQVAEIHMPTSIHGSFAGTAQTYQNSIANEPILIAASILVIYIVLGILYESYLHPLTIISTVPSAGLGAVLALMLFKTDFSLIALIGVILLIGLVMKNAIMLVDFAIAAERQDGLSIRDSIGRATVLRFRPILMTTCAAILGAVPLAAGFGDGAELRRPLGISIVGGLIVSQILTLYTTPVIYVYINRFRIRREQRKARALQAHGSSAVPSAV